MKITLLSLLMIVPSVVMGTKGVDVSVLVDNFSCMKQSGYTFAVPRGYRSYGVVDPNVLTNIKNARSAGMSAVDVYLFPCVPCGDAKGQAEELVKHLEGASYGMIWVDVERYRWSPNKSSNQAFVKEMVNALESKRVKAGIYTNYYNWEEIMGLDYDGVSDLPLWYAHYDDNPSFSDFEAFGGWRKPSIKQYKGDTTLCGFGVDLNYY